MVGIVASVIMVITQQVMKPPMVDEEYVAASYRNESPTAVWSGNTKSDVSLMQAVESKSKAASAPVATPVSLTEAMKAQAVVAGIEDIDSKRDAIAASLSAFFGTTTPESRSALIRDAARVKPLMMSYYSREPMPLLKWRGLGRMVRVDEPGYRFGYVQALFEDANPANVIVEETDDRRYLIDWECLVRYGEVAWPDFLRMKPVEPKLMRVIASKAESSPPSGTVMGQGEWLELRHPAESGTVLGYFDRNDPKFAALVQQLEMGQWKDVPVTLRLCFPAAPSSRVPGAGVQIAGVEGKGWLILRGGSQL